MDDTSQLLDAVAKNAGQMASPKSDYFAPSDEEGSGTTRTSETNGELEKDYDFGSASSNRESGLDSDEDSWETVSEEMRQEALEHQADGHCLCTTCTMKSLNISTRIQNRSTHETQDLPENVSKLITECGAKIYVVGTAHFSEASQDDVARVIRLLSPDVVMVELCAGREGVLKYDEEALLNAAQDVSLAKLRVTIRESGSVISGIMQLLLLSMSAHITKQLGMAPGGEFRVAWKEARLIPGCKLVLGDRPIQATLGRAMASLSICQKIKLGWHLLFSNGDITKEDVEKYKEKDMIAEMIEEMTGHFPELSRVFVDERDQYMAQMLLHCIEVIRRDLPRVINTTTGEDNKNRQNISEAMESDEQPELHDNFPDDLTRDGAIEEIDNNTNGIKEDEISSLEYQPVLVAVVGIGHMKGIMENMGKTCDLEELELIPPPTYASRAFAIAVKSVPPLLVAAFSWGVYSVYRWVRS